MQRTLQPKKPTALQCLDSADQYFELQDYSAALLDYQVAVQLIATFNLSIQAACFSKLGYCYAKLDKHNEAILNYKEAIDRLPMQPEFYELRATSYRVTECLPAAISDYQIAKQKYTVVTDKARCQKFIEQLIKLTEALQAEQKTRPAATASCSSMQA